MAVIRRISSKTLADILLLHPQPRISSCVFAVNKQNFSKGIVRLQDQENDSETKKIIQKAIHDPFHFKKTEQETKTDKSLVVAQEKNLDEFTLPHPIWSNEEVDSVHVTHKKPEGFVDHLAYYCVMAMRTSFDFASGYTIGKSMQTLDERSVLIRCIFLETVAGVPGFAAAMIRHLDSLRKMQRDHGWIHTLLEEAENERMHLMTFMTLKHPGPFFRFNVIFTQYVFTALFSMAYLISPRFCHRFVGYLEEQAVVTYTHILEELDAGRLPMWSALPAPDIAIKYWELPNNAMMRDVILAIRADEAHHRIVNHTLGSMKPADQNPFRPGA